MQLAQNCYALNSEGVTSYNLDYNPFWVVSWARAYCFLPLEFILQNIVLTQEALFWVKTPTQQTIFLKLESCKAYDKVSWIFLYYAMQWMGIRSNALDGSKCFLKTPQLQLIWTVVLGRILNLKEGFARGAHLCPISFWLWRKSPHILSRK